MTDKPLAGVTVLEFTRLLPGPLATMFLGDLGADVIKIEDTKFGDYIRKIGPLSGENSARFHVLNRNKRSLRIDYRTPEGRDVVRRLAESADILLEGFRPGAMDEMGLGYEELRQRNPRLVYCSLSGFGQTGPLRGRAGHDMNYASYAGLTDQIGGRGGPPSDANFQFADIAGGTSGAMMGMLAALFDAQRSGRGRYIDASITDCTLAMTVIPMSSWNADGSVPERGNDIISGQYPWYGFYETSDGKYVHLGALEWRFWQNFCDAIGQPEWGEQQFASGAQADEIRAGVAAHLLTNTRDHWVETLGPLDTCVAPVWTLKEAHESALFRAREMFVEYDHPVDGKIVQAAFPLKMTDFEFEVRPAPLHGEHTSEILDEAGFDEAEQEGLRAADVI
ncbi:MAG: CaiB/BaiF CoA-transferase family protein [Alphaproteobacteria bacterium]|jgi:crotonobetainyl-CoA:carnitine CoA-transferase CaiB-like acyl-CoA transferase|nr:CaiB/BaiF CoA-transferase family protein [Alphaproteobacteria bacterium]